MDFNNQQQQSSVSPRGIIKRWDDQRHFGIVYATEGKRYFLNIIMVIEATPELFRKVTFDIGVARRPEELEQALNVRVGDKVVGGSL